MYPCQYPGCNARYDESLDGQTEDVAGDNIRLNGWIYPWDAETAESILTHDHVINVLVKVEVED
jgi:hypothetical protein